MDDKITIIEGPPPEFESVDDGWALGLNESSGMYDMAIARLRTYNSQALVERCYRAWNSQSTMFLHYRNTMGLEEKAPILAARAVDTTDGQMLLLWVRRPPDDEEDEIGMDDDSFED